MGFFEVEQKYRLKDPSAARQVLKKIGARKIASGLEQNEFYDCCGVLCRKKTALRLRKFGKGPAVLTLKGPKLKAHFTKRMEIETPLDPAAAKAILGILGFRLWKRYAKHRELYKAGGALITLDFLKKFGWFLEIEGNPSAIRKFEKKFGFGSADREKRSYLQMMFGWKF
ncbi:MAG TPA: class IV adenylate cyclase [Candidatus Omnitrophota bacterium]|nr:class IV adenylate cyclase [Candidatus Omnitrophota bacterium]HRY84921.1 class IV adenylate cyclase [Candidatus Omnitrophota bacterium]